ncbi:TetR family transcriptional regulator [Microvirga tunisiensis]|uniref:TetR family transcriptional regulator n=2 Tax=Pannonibacter tanglangensis TaxID=2750084 RepID=A0ABW9ZJW3_9HYPH|nr:MULTISPECIES: TetR/AcrR family transcriptional regulator C-terminal domain-containing protein [unclassified Pannonibacter]NBN63344.1 TetR family transcriptional regulator [Pannonibacter sp. XCT-34]NBN76979.1 TetR family transcriptional regulator [Pannonibacter sp. XCT-53]
MSKKPGEGRQGPRGIDPQAVLDAAIRMRETEGPDGFSLRRLAQSLGLDPMTVQYHFGSKEKLERAMGDRLNAELIPVDPATPWRSRLENLAFQYRRVALAYPHTFPLLLRFWVTGPADIRHAEMVYVALADAGFNAEDMVDYCVGWYAAVLGLAAAEAGGLLRPASQAMLDETDQLAPADFPHTTRLAGEFRRQVEGRAFRKALDRIMDGMELAAARARGEA